MLGLFQAEIPVGRQLWVIILITVIFGWFSALPIANPAEQPVKFASDTLLFFGYVYVFLLAIFVCVGIPLGVLVYGSQKLHQKRAKMEDGIFQYRFMVKKPYQWIFSVFGILGIATATLLAARGYGTAAMYSWGKWGLLLSLVLLWFGYAPWGTTNILIIHPYGLVKTGVVIGNHGGQFEVELDSNWLAELTSLLDYGWELVEFNTQGKPSVILQRKGG